MKRIVLLLLFCLGMTQAFAQNVLDIGQKLTIKSKVLGEERELLIYLPTGYHSSEARYPVLYMLDGTFHFHHLTGMVDFMSATGRIPKLIVVAVVNTNRDRDMTPPILKATQEQKIYPNSGGADAFLKFFRQEVFPKVEKKYRTQPYRLFGGHSYGGLFGIHTFIKKTNTFNAYICISPSLWWDGQLAADELVAFFQKEKNLNHFLYMSLANERGEMKEAFLKTKTLLETHQPKDFEQMLEHFPNETHLSVPHRSLYNALDSLFSDWRFPNEIALSGLKGLDLHLKQLSKKYQFPIQPKESTINRLGYMALRADEVDTAIAFFKKNVADYPLSFNVYDSLGEAYFKKGDTKKAKAMYEKCLVLNPYSQHAKEMLEKLEKEGK